MRIASFDIGKKNLSLYIEDFDPADVKALIFPETLFTDNRDPTPEFRAVLDTLYQIGSCRCLELYDVSCNSRGSFVPKETYHAVIDLLQSLKHLFDTTEVVLLEEQLVRRNPMAFKIAQHIYSWFLITYGRDKQVAFFPAIHRNHTLGCPKRFLHGQRMKKLTKYRRKRWAVKEARTLVELRADECLTAWFDKRKQDDMADAILDAKAWQLRTFK
jgi:hypothetical protein